MRRGIERAANQVYDNVVTQPAAQMNALQKLGSRAQSIFIVWTLILVICAGGFSLSEGKSFGDGIWWAIVTATSVGYGDHFPVTTTGRLVGGFLMTSSLLLIIPVITAKLAAIMIVDSDAFTHAEQEEIKSLLREVLARVDELEKKL